MKKTVLKITFDSKKETMDVRDCGINSGNPAKDDATLLFTLASCIVGKLRTMPIDAKMARKCFDRVCGEMERLFTETFPESEEETNE